MSKRIKQVCSSLIAMVMVFSLSFTTTVYAATGGAGAIITDANTRTKLTFLEGTPGDTHLVYTYKENGQQYKVVENANADFTQVSSIFYVMDSEGNYTEAKSQVLDVQPNGIVVLRNTDAKGHVEVALVETSIDEAMADAASVDGDPGLGEWITSAWDGNSRIYNMAVSIISAVLGAALGGKIGAAIGAIASSYFQVSAEYAYYHVVDNWMMSALYPTWYIIAESRSTNYYLNAAHTVHTGYDYYFWDGRW